MDEVGEDGGSNFNQSQATLLTEAFMDTPTTEMRQNLIEMIKRLRLGSKNRRSKKVNRVGNSVKIASPFEKFNIDSLKPLKYNMYYSVFCKYLRKFRKQIRADFEGQEGQCRMLCFN